MALLVPGRAPGAAAPADAVPGGPGRPPVPRDHRSRTAPGRLLLAAVLLALLLVVLVVALVVGGGRPQPATPGLPAAGPVTGWGAPVVTLLARMASLMTVGPLVLAALLLPRSLPGAPALAARAVRVAGAGAVVWLLAEGFRTLLLTSSLLGVPVASVPPRALLEVLTGLAPGRAALLQAVLLVLLVLGCHAAGAVRPVRSGPGGLRCAGLLLAALAALLAPVVLAGHAAGSGDHVLAVVSLAVHVVTAAAWVGGLGAVVLLGRRAARPGAVVRRFSSLALVCVLLLAGSGLLSATVLTGASGPTTGWALLSTGYGVLLLVKTGALAALTVVGVLHRRHTVRALEAGRPQAFRRLAVVELVLMAATVAVAVGLAASPPPAVDGPTGPTGPPTAAGAPTVDGGPAVPGGPGVVGAPAPSEADPMAGHDHGELSVGVLVDGTRFHVGGPVRAGQSVTVYNSGGTAVTITAVDGSFDVDVPGGTFITFGAPEQPGSYPFASRTDPAFADVLMVEGG